jgi:hypothetical protein
VRAMLAASIPLALSIALSVPFVAPTTVAAQGIVYTLDPSSSFVSGCTGPSICLCPVVMVGPLSGSFTLTLLLPPLGPIYEYAVTDFEAVATPLSGTPIVLSGSGLYTIDLVADTQTLLLDLLVDGIPATFISIGTVEMTVPFPDAVRVDAFTPVQQPCLYDGVLLSAAPSTAVPFLRGDANEDGVLDISDAVAALAGLFPAPGLPLVDCLDAADANDDGTFDIADPIALLAGLFGSGGDPAPPYPGCGTDPTADGIGCAGHDSCP